MSPDAEYVARIVDAFTDLMRREQRVDLGFSEVARRFQAAGGGRVTPQVMGRWLKGHEQPRDAKRRMAFARVLGVSTGWLFYKEGAKVAVIDPVIPPLDKLVPHADPAVADASHRRTKKGGGRR